MLYVWRMTVADYLERERITAGALAKRLRVSRVCVYQWKAGAIPRGENIRKLEDGTKGPNGEPGVTLEAMLAAQRTRGADLAEGAA